MLSAFPLTPNRYMHKEPEDDYGRTPPFGHEESTHENSRNRACKLRPLIWHASGHSIRAVG